MRVVLTGGGTGGHVVPNLAVIEDLREISAKKSSAPLPESSSSQYSASGNSADSVEILYIGSVDGMEKAMVEKAGVKYRGVACGKLRRYFSLKNFTDLFRVPVGVGQAYFIMRNFRPDVVFSKGGFVSLPVVVAAKILGVPVILHESDMSPGLANRMCAKFASRICVSFEESIGSFAKYAGKVIYTGAPVRKSILTGVAAKGLEFTGFDKFRPVILVMGGSLGAAQINKLVDESLGELLKKFQVVHIRGRGNLNIGVHERGYRQFEYLNERLKDVYAMSEIVVSRGGANSLFELAMLGKKVLVIPISGGHTRGDQLENAEFFARKYGWKILGGAVTGKDFVEAVEGLKEASVTKVQCENGLEKVVEIIRSFL